MDKEYIVLHAIEENANVTQRELSSKTQISLGSVNLLINKMVKEGLVKINQIPMNRVTYMLTPKGMAEKINKTSKYIKYHYNYINEMKERMQEQLLKLVAEHQKIYVVLEDDEISEMVKLAAHNIDEVGYIKWNGEAAALVDRIRETSIGRGKVIVVSSLAYEILRGVDEVVNLLERI